MIIRYQRITDWPRKRTYPRTTSQFKASYLDTLDEIESEIEKLGGSDVVLQGFVARTNIRNDGWPKADARADEPGVIVSFSTKRHGPMVYHADQYIHWKDNIRAIGKTLEALRAIKRYGAVAGEEQYKGFVLEAPAINDRAAAVTLIRLAGAHIDADELLDRSDRPKAIDDLRRRALKRVHPDVVDGDRADYELLENAIRVLKGTS